MKKITVYHYDAFTTEPDKGNPAGVVLDADGLTDEENRYPKYAKGGIKNECVAFAEIGEEEYSGELNLIVMPKTMKKKRFIKLIMSKGYQRNKANKMHQEYMEKYKYRTMIGLMVFLECYNIKPIFKLKIGEKIFEGEMRYEKGNDISSR